MKAASKPAVALILRAKEAGFTLVELLITIVILGILTSLAVPSFRGFIADQRVKTASFDIMAMLTLARSEAIKRNKAVNIQDMSTYYKVSFLSPTTILLKLEKPADVNIATASNCFISYQATGRLPPTAACTQFEISSTASTLRRCIKIDLSGRPTVKNMAC